MGRCLQPRKHKQRDPGGLQLQRKFWMPWYRYNFGPHSTVTTSRLTKLQFSEDLRGAQDLLFLLRRPRDRAMRLCATSPTSPSFPFTLLYSLSLCLSPPPRLLSLCMRYIPLQYSSIMNLMKKFCCVWSPVWMSTSNLLKNFYEVQIYAVTRQKLPIKKEWKKILGPLNLKNKNQRS